MYIKDNLAKRHWTDCKKCVLYDLEDSVKNLFISNPFARLSWRIFHFTFNKPPPTDVTILFVKWLNGIDKKTKVQICVGVYILV